ncbi:GNAT family N-acetyltransferase [Streptococcus pyogenes]|uniref:GNAT family N-acetyltransferase n=1 Tax=Streptococcus pyogenes TaxID=1314 RepID=UPI000DA3997C|nr:GNAT family protein [Streptococcus pyogenes]SQG52538.1 acetyltransferase family protein [Streptococcus pyogenes]
MDIWTKLAVFAFFETPKVILRPFRYEDHWDFYSMVNDTKNLYYVFPEQKTKAASDYLLVHSFIKFPLGQWAIDDKATHQVIGSIRIEHYDAKTRCADIGYFLNYAFWGQGIMTEVVIKLVYLSFHEFGLKTLRIITHLENKASQKVAKKAGFQLKTCFKGSDRNTHKICIYKMYQLTNDR